MNLITQQTRSESYEAAKKEAAARRCVILEIYQEQWWTTEH